MLLTLTTTRRRATDLGHGPPAGEPGSARVTADGVRFSRKNSADGGIYSYGRTSPIAPTDRSRVREQDLALARRAAAGDRGALHAVVDRHAAGLYRLARGLCPCAADAEDVVQETLVAVIRWIGTFDGRASLMTWMSHILVRQARKAAERRSRGRALPLDEAADSARAEAKGGRSPNSDDCRLDLAAALPKLAPDFREVIVLRELQGMSYAEIATTLGIPQGTVESRIHRARAELRQWLRAYRVQGDH